MDNILQSKISLKDNFYDDEKHKLWHVSSFEISLSFPWSEKEQRNILGLKKRESGHLKKRSWPLSNIQHFLRDSKYLITINDNYSHRTVETMDAF